MSVSPLLGVVCNPPPPKLVLPRRVDALAARTLSDALCAFRGEDLHIDGSTVEFLGREGLGMLLAAIELWAIDGKTLEIHSPSPRLLEDLEDLGVVRVPTEQAA